MQRATAAEQKRKKKTAKGRRQKAARNTLRLPWKTTAALDTVQALAAWPATLRVLLAEYASPACVVVVYRCRKNPAETVLVLTPDVLAAGTGKPLVDIESEQWRARHEVHLPGYGAASTRLLFPADGGVKLVFYADAAGDYLLAPDRSLLYDLQTHRATLFPRAVGERCINPSPYSSAVAFSNDRHTIEVGARRSTAPSPPTTAFDRPADKHAAYWFWTRCCHTEEASRRPRQRQNRTGQEASDVAPDVREAGPAYLHVLCMGFAERATLMAWNSATDVWLPLPVCSNLFYSHDRSRVVVLRGGRHVVVIGGCVSPTGHLRSAEVYDAATGAWCAAPQWAPPLPHASLYRSEVTECDGYLFYFIDGHVFAALASPASSSDPLPLPTVVAHEADAAASDTSADCTGGSGGPVGAYVRSTTWVHIAHMKSVEHHECSVATVPALADRAALRAVLRAERDTQV